LKLIEPFVKVIKISSFALETTIFRDDNGYLMGKNKILQCLSLYPHLEKIPIPELIPSWATTLVPSPYPYGYFNAHTRTHYPHFNYKKTIKI
jgi:hypothetical protein